MSEIFISHSSADAALAEELRDRLHRLGYQAVFLDSAIADGLPAGHKWERELYVALRRCSAVLFIASPSSIDSRWCFAELTLARSLSTPIFVIRAAEGVKLSLLDDVQWVDLAEKEAAFERLWVGMRLAELDPATSISWDPTRTPYPGLRAFSTADAAVFFGRRHETERLVELLQPMLTRGPGRWVTIVGPSGSGKSSLLSAGLLPHLARTPERWIIVPMFVPSDRPFWQLALSLSRVLAANGHPRGASDIEKALRDDSEGSRALVELARDLRDAVGDESSGVLIVIDQAEEIASRNGPREQQSFLRLLKGATGDNSPLWVICTLRSEFLSTAPERAGMSEVTDSSLVLEPLSRSRLSEVIAGPAHRAGLVFAPGLTERMVEDTKGGDALPLLAHTLYELASKAKADGLDRIRVVDYESMGGVVGSLQRRADKLVQELSADGEHGPMILPTLLKLVTTDPNGEPIRRRVSRDAFDAEELGVIDAFVDARLLSSGYGEEARPGPVVEVTHEALLRQWPPLSKAIAASKDSLRLRAELEREAADWDYGKREESYLLRGARLAAFSEWAERDDVELSPLDLQFLAASQELASRELAKVRRSNRRLRQLLGGVALFLVVAIVAAAVAVIRTNEARHQAAISLTRQLLSEAATLRTAQPDVALLLDVEALEGTPPELAADARLALAQSLNRQFHVETGYFAPGDGNDVAVRAVAFSPRGDVIASGGNDRLVRMWDVASGVPRGGPLEGHTGRVQAVAFSHDGSRLASGSSDDTVRIWDTSSGRQQGEPLVGNAGAITGVAFNTAGDLLATSSEDGTVRLWDVATGRQRGAPLIKETTPMWGVALSPDGSLVASGGADGAVHLWNVGSGRPSGSPLLGHSGWAIGMAFNSDGSLLASSGADGTVRLWDVATHRPHGPVMMGHVGEVTDVRFSPDGSLLASAGRDGTVRLWDVLTGRPHDDPITGHGNAVRSLAFSPNGQTLASASFDGTVRLWDVHVTRPLTDPLVGQGVRVDDVSFGSAESAGWFVSATADGSTKVWDTRYPAQPRWTLLGNAGWVTSAVFNPITPTMVATSGTDGTIRLWDARTGRSMAPPLRGHTGEISSVAFSPDGRLLASAGRDGTVRLWDVQSGEQDGFPLLGQGGQVTNVAFSPDGAMLASAGEDGGIRVWDLATGKLLGNVLIGHTGWVLSLAFDPESGILASGGGDGTIRLWDLKTWSEKAQLVGHSNEVNDVAFSPDGTTLASAAKDNTVRLWDVESGRLIGDPLPFAVQPTSLSFDHGGSTLAVGDVDGVVHLFDMDPAHLNAEGCRIADRNLTPNEWERLIGTAAPYRKTCPMAPN